jgi:diguanylate cyclase (GGDEF)-like protein
MKQKISQLEKIEIIATNSSDKELMLSGFLSSLNIILITTFVVVLLNIVSATSVIQIIGKSLSYTIVLGIIGMIASKLRKYEYTHSTIIPLVYIIFTLAIFFIIMTELSISIIQNTNFRTSILSSLRFEDINYQFWIIIVITVFFLSLTFGAPLEIFWTKWYNFYLDKITSIDYRAIYNERHFYTELSESFYNAQRYNTTFSIVILNFDNYEVLKNRYSRRKLLSIQDEIIDVLNDSIRKTDVVGYIKEGELFAIVLHANKTTAEEITKRITNRLSIVMAEKYGKELSSITSRVYGYTTAWKSVDDIIKEITSGKKLEENDKVVRL